MDIAYENRRDALSNGAARHQVDRAVGIPEHPRARTGLRDSLPSPRRNSTHADGTACTNPPRDRRTRIRESRAAGPLAQSRCAAGGSPGHAAGAPRDFAAAGPIRRRRHRAACSPTGSMRSRHPYYATIAALRVSAHFLIRRDGALLQFVSCNDRAWHAGESAWKGRANCNDYSIGIELEGADDMPYAAAQYTMLARLARSLRPPLSHRRHRRPQRRRPRAQDRSRAPRSTGRGSAGSSRLRRPGPASGAAADRANPSGRPGRGCPVEAEA